jgi:hypothetical protein
MTVFCIGLGAIVESVGARFKSDEKALALIKQARLAIGGDQSIAEVRSMIIKGTTIHTMKMGGETRTNQGETEIAMQLPDKLSKMVRMGRHDGGDVEKIVSEKHDVFVMKGDLKGEWTNDNGNKIIVRKVEGENGNVEKIVTRGKDGEFTTSDGKKVIIRSSSGGEDVENVIAHSGENGKRIVMETDARAGHNAARQNELLRTTLSLLLTAPEGMDVDYTFLGEGDVDGTTCNIVNASFGGSNIKLYLSKASSLPVMVSYQGHAMAHVMHFKSKGHEGADAAKGVVTFNHKMEGPEMAEFSVRFSDYRGTGGVQLPYRWSTSDGSETREVFDVTSYEINPANIAEKFQNQKVLVRTKKDTN